eukprot:4742789-Amphidinium_carterae.2
MQDWQLITTRSLKHLVPTAEAQRQREDVEVTGQAGSQSAPTLRDEGNSLGSTAGSRLPG